MSETLHVGEGGYATIQAAVDAASAGDTIMVGAGTFAGANIGKELTLIGQGESTLISVAGSNGFRLVGDIDAGAAGGDGAATVTIQGFNFVGNAFGVSVAATTNLDHLVVDGSHFTGNTNTGISTGGTLLSQIDITNSTFAHNGTGSISGSGDISLFNFLGDALLQNVTVEGGANATPNATNGQFGIQVAGFDASTYDVTHPIGDVVFDNVSVTGTYLKTLLYVQGYTSLDTLTFLPSGTTVDGHAGWGFDVIVDPTADMSSANPAGVPGRPGFFDDGAAGALAPDTVDLSNLTVGDGGAVFNGTPVADDVIGTPGTDILSGDAGDDSLAGGESNDTLEGDEGNDTLQGDDGDDSLVGGNGNDALEGGNGSDTLAGGNGNDSLDGGGGNDTLDGGAGIDTASYAGTVTVTEAGAAWTVDGGAEGTDALGNIEVVNDAASGKILLVGNGGYATIQEAVDAASAGDTILVGSGTFAGANIGKELTLIGQGEGTVITSPGSNGFQLVGDIDANAAGGDGAATVTIQGFSFVGNSVGVQVSSTTNLDHLIVDDSHFEGNSVNGIGMGSGGPLLSQLDITNSTFAQNGSGSVSGSGDISLFQFYGDALLQNVTIEGGENATPNGSNGQFGIQIAGFDPGTYDVTHPIGDIVFDNVSVTGAYTKLLLYVQGYTNLDGLSFLDSGTTIDGHAGWGWAVGIDPTAGMSSANPAGVPGRPGFFDDTAAGALAPDTVDLSNVTVGNDVVINVPEGHPLFAFNGMALGTVFSGTPVADHVIGTSGFDVMGGGAGDDSLAGGDGTDFLTAGAGEDTLLGGNDNDTLGGGEGNDTLDGGNGDDSLDGGFANDSLAGADGDDTLQGFVGSDTLSGGNGFDSILGGGGNDLLQGGLNADTLSGDNGDDTLSGGNGSDLLIGGNGNDNLLGGAGQDNMLGDAGNDTLDGGTLNDTLAGGNGDDSLLGGDGNDSIEAEDGNDTASGGNGDDFLDGGNGNDVIDGGLGNDTIDSETGDDSVLGGDGDDFISACDGNDTLSGGNGNDTILGGADAGNDVVDGGEGNDSILGGAGNDSVLGGNGSDTLDGGNGDDTLDGGADNDSVSGADGNDSILGGEGNDTLSGGNGVDLVDGGNGNDLVQGGLDADSLFGGEGNDTVSGGNGADSLFGGNGDDSVLGGAGDDTVQGEDGNDTVDGGIGNDSLFGGNGFDSVVAGDGNDFIGGGLNSDTISGGNGDDTLNGGNGSDHLLGGNGADVLTGGVGLDSIDAGGNDGAADLFNYTAPSLGTADVVALQSDSITGIDAFDKLDITDSLADALKSGGITLGSDAQDVVLGATLQAGSTNIAFDNASDLLMVDLNGDGVFNSANDFSIHLVGVASVTYQGPEGLSQFTFTLDP